MASNRTHIHIRNRIAKCLLKEIVHKIAFLNNEIKKLKVEIRLQKENARLQIELTQCETELCNFLHAKRKLKRLAIPKEF